MKSELIPELKDSQLKVRRIMVPVDFSGAACEALAYAVPLAKNLGAKIILLHVVEPIYAGAEPGFGYMPEQTEGQESAARELMRKIAAEYIPKGLFEKAILRLGSPFHEITAAAKSLDVGLIVITTHGRTGLSHVLMGSTTERVVRHAVCPVLTVKRTNANGPGWPARRVRAARGENMSHTAGLRAGRKAASAHKSE